MSGNFIIHDDVLPSPVPTRVLERQWNHRCSSMQSTDRYRLLNVRVTLICESRQPLTVDDVWAKCVVGETSRFTLPLLPDYGIGGDRENTLAVQEDSGAQWRRGWTPFGLDVPGRQSLYISITWAPDFIRRFVEIIGPKHIDVRAAFSQVS